MLKRSKLRVYQVVIKPTICYVCETFVSFQNAEELKNVWPRQGSKQGPIWHLRTNAEVRDLYQKPDTVKSNKIPAGVADTQVKEQHFKRVTASIQVIYDRKEATMD